MPHQEARFLTPLILPLVISLSGRIARLGRRFWVRFFFGLDYYSQKQTIRASWNMEN
jgi:hypothetical protein